MALRVTYTERVMTVQTGIIAAPKPDKFPTETAFYHALKKALNFHGYLFRGEKFNLVKKLMWKDGHLVDDTQYYLRDAKGRYCIYDPEYAVRDIAKHFNKHEFVTLSIHDLI